jgi:hypothetical protein
LASFYGLANPLTFAEGQDPRKSPPSTHAPAGFFARQQSILRDLFFLSALSPAGGFNASGTHRMVSVVRNSLVDTQTFSQHGAAWFYVAIFKITLLLNWQRV